jgi:ubiquinone/menaquinone biosynthesis C-methylase UbiE
MQPICFDAAFLVAMNQYRQSEHAQRRFRRYLELLNPLPGQHILDLGCGSGDFCRALVPHVTPGGHITGVDLAPNAIHLSARLAATLDTTLFTFEQGDGHCLCYADGSFDAAVCISVLAFCAEPVRVLAELRRVLRGGGRLLVASADEDTRFYNGQEQALGRRILRAIADRGHDPWTGRRLAAWLRHAGFTIVEELVLAQIEHDFNPGAGGYILAHALHDYLLGSGISTWEYERWLADLQACAAEGAYGYGVTTFVYLVE